MSPQTEHIPIVEPVEFLGSLEKLPSPHQQRAFHISHSWPAFWSQCQNSSAWARHLSPTEAAKLTSQRSRLS